MSREGPQAAPRELTDAELLKIWRECDRDPLRFAYKLREENQNNVKHPSPV